MININLRGAFLACSWAAVFFSAFSMSSRASEVIMEDSVAGFSNIQGKNNWHYGYSTAPFGVADFTPFSQFGPYDGVQLGGDTWHLDSSNYWTLLSAEGGHPQGDVTSGGKIPVVHWAVRRWISPKEGNVSIYGNTADLGASEGNGVVVRISVDGTEVFSRVLENGSSADQPYLVKTALRAGSIVDFAIDPRDGNDHSDTTRFTAHILNDFDFPDWRNAVSSVGTPPVVTRFEPAWGGQPVPLSTGALTGDRSFEFIVNAGPAGPSSVLLGNPASQALKFEQYQDSEVFGVTDYGVQDHYSSAAFAMKRETHVVYTSTGNNTLLYVDGKLRHTFSGVPLNLAGDVWLAGAPFNEQLPFIDRLDGFVLGFASYDSALSAQEVRDHFLASAIVPKGTILAARSAGPVSAVAGTGAVVEIFNGLGDSSEPQSSRMARVMPDSVMLSPSIDFPRPGATITVGSAFDQFFNSTASAPSELSQVPASNFMLRVSALLKVTADLDLDPLTPEIELEIGVGSDDGFLLTVGQEDQGTMYGRPFAETWMPLTFRASGLYPVTLLYSANNESESGLELSWKTARAVVPEIIPQAFLYSRSPAGPQEHALMLNQRARGGIDAPFTVERWNFAGLQGQKLWFEIDNADWNPGVIFTLRGPGNWVGFSNLTGSSGVITLPVAGAYTLEAAGIHATAPGAYTFRLVEAVQDSLRVYTEDFTTNVTDESEPAGRRVVVTSVNPGESNWVSPGGRHGGYLRLTDAAGSQQATAVFPAFQGAAITSAFTFDADCRIAGDSASIPADGFSLSVVPSGHPLLAGGLADENGTNEGLTVSFDTWDNGGEVVGVKVKLDGVVLASRAMPVRNGAVNDPESIQTGTLAMPGWTGLRVVMRPDSTLDVYYKGVKLLGNVVAPLPPAQWRFVLAARTGGAVETHHFDNVAITAATTKFTNQVLTLNQRMNGRVDGPYDGERWLFQGRQGQSLRLNVINASSPGLLYSLRGPNGWQGFVSLAGSSDAVLLPSSGEYELTVVGSGASAQTSHAFEVVDQVLTELSVGPALTGTFGGSGEAQLFRLEITESGPLNLNFLNSGTGNRVEFYAARGGFPIRGSGEYQDASGPGSNRSLSIANASPGIWYVLVYGDLISSSGSFTIQASRPGIALTGITPARHASNLPITMLLSGAGFQSGAAVELVSAGGVVLPAKSVSVDSLTGLTAEFDAFNAQSGRYDVRVRQGNGLTATLPSAFEILAPGEPRLETRLIMPGELGRHAVATIYVEYANTGNAAMPAPLLILKSSDPDGSDRPILTMDHSRIIQDFWSGTAGLPPATSHQALVLASGAQPGVLNPGERLQVPVYYLGLMQPWDFGDGEVEMEIRYWTAEDTAPIDWAARKEALRPPTLETAAWDVVYANLTSGLGTTAAYVRMLNDNAEYLGRLGRRVMDVDELWSFEVQQAYGFSPLRVLDSATDSTMMAPGVSLDLTRKFASNIRSRQAAGPFGRGWYSPWQARLTVEREGSLARLTGEGGSARVYSLDIRNNGYFSGAGDSSSLIRDGSGYQLRDPNGTVTGFRADGRIGFVRDVNGNQVNAAWGGNGQLVSLTHSSGASITLTYGGNGLISRAANSAGRALTYTYSGNYLASVTTDDGKVTQYTYETAGTPAQRHALTSVSRGGVARHFTWDAQGRLESSSLASGADMTLFGYGSAGEVTVSMAGGVTQLFFDHHGLLAKTVDPLGNITASEFDDDLRLRRLVLPTGDSRSFTWCNCGSPTSITDELGNVTRFKYDHPLKKMTRFTDAKGNVTNYNYDAKGNLLETVYADSTVESLGGYSVPGLPGTRTNRRGNVISHTWTVAGQVDRKTFADGSYHDFDYDARGNLIKVTEHPSEGPDKITLYTFNPATDGDRLKKVTYPNNRWVEYFYDAEGRRARMADSAGGDTRYDYDTAGRLWKVSDTAGAVLAEYLYDAAGRLLRINKGNDTWTTYEYDAAGQILRLINHAPNGAVNSRFIYTYDARGRRTAMDTLDGKWTYDYDATGQLTHAVLNSIDPEIPGQDLRYNYDALGNRISAVLNGIHVIYSVGELNQYLSVMGVDYQYDEDGNLVFDGIRIYSYDPENRLVRVVGPEGDSEYEYDPLGNRAAVVLDGGRTEYLMDPTGMGNVIAEQASDRSSRFSFGFGLLNQTNQSGVLFFEFDAIGSTVGVSGYDGTQKGNSSYSAFGENLFSNLDASINARFVGQFGVVSEPNGLVFMRNRFYLPHLGVFASPDPIQLMSGDFNYYSYVLNDPIGAIDPTGLVPESVDIGRGIPENQRYINGLDLRHAAAGCRLGQMGGSYFGRALANTLGFGVEIVQLRADPESAFKSEDFRSNDFGGRYGAAGGNCEDFIPKGTPKSPSGVPDFGNGGWFGSANSVNSTDPNEKIGPAGYGPQSWIQANAVMPYRINFENLGPGSKDPNGNPYPNPATAPAQRVTVTDQLQPQLDWSTFRFTEFGFGDTLVPVPAGSGSGSGGASHFTGSVPMTYNGQTFNVEIDAGIDFSTGMVTVRFQSINPETSLPPDVLTGLLPPEDGTGRGKGHFSYLISPKAGLPDGTAIRNVADIRFDINTVIATDQVDPQDPSKGRDPSKQALVTLDGTPPSSSVTALSANAPAASFPVSWTGTDTGSGIAAYDIYVSDNGGAWTLWKESTVDLTGVFTGISGHTYGFHSVAWDYAGLREAAPSTADAVTTLAGSAPVFAGVPATVRAPIGQAFTLTVGVQNGPAGFSANGLPPGFSIHPQTGVITGTASAEGAYPVEITAVNAGGSASVSFTLSLFGMPVFTVPGRFEAPLNKPFTLQLAATNDPDSYDAQGLPEGLSIDMETGLINGTPSSAGEYAGRFLATNIVGTSTLPFVFVVPPGPFEAWRQKQFTGAELADPLISGPLSDADGDGLRNVLEYALGLPPKAPQAPDVSLGLARVEGIERSVFQFTRPDVGEDTTLFVEESTDLEIWNRVAVKTGSDPWSGVLVMEAPLLNGRVAVSVYSTSMNAPRFLRLGCEVSD